MRLSGMKMSLAVIVLLNLFMNFKGELHGQEWSGRILSSENSEGISYVNVGIIGRNRGTVSDESGNFSIKIDSSFIYDSIRFSMVGFENHTISVRQFISDTTRNFYMDPVSYELPEIEVRYHRPKRQIVGNPVDTDRLRSGFADNSLGSELGIMAVARKKALVKDINLNIAVCTYDSVTYRLNIYLVEDEVICNNILKEPIYLSFSKNSLSDIITIDLQKYSIVVEGDILISLEMYKDLKEGKLLFRTEFFTGETYHRKTSEGDWTKSPGIVGIYLNTLVLD